MKKEIVIGLLPGLLLIFAAVSLSGQDVSTEVQKALDRIDGMVDKARGLSPTAKAFVKSELVPLCNNQIFVQAVKAQNAKGISLDEIKRIDEEWVYAEEKLPIQKEKLENECAREIIKIVAKLGRIAETFVMDNQGANVGQNVITSDYWQGDEPKWLNSYNDGLGGVDVSDKRLDKSSNKVDQKVSLPIIDNNGEVVGAISYGLTLDE